MKLQANSEGHPVALGQRQQASITSWVEKNVGGHVTSVLQLRRWRPVWRVDYEREGEARALLVKSLRAWEAIPYSLRHEMQLMQILEEHGIRVPHVHGMMEFPEAFVMDWVEGGRDPGLVQQATENASTMSPERWQASLKYMEVLAKMHSIPIEAFAATEAGNPIGARAIALDHYERNYDLLAKRNAVDAMIEFFTLWLRRNVPQHRTTRTFVTGDCGQFLSKGTEITAILDVEIGHIGDPLHDLACFRGRHPVENMGDVPALFRHYAQVTGESLDLRVIAYHTVVFLALATIGPILALSEKHPGGDWVEGVMQLAFIGRRALDAIAELAGVELDELQLPEPHVVPLGELAIAKLLGEIERIPSSDILPGWQREVLSTLPVFLKSQFRYGRWVEGEDVRDIGELVGVRQRDILSAEKALKTFVQSATPKDDARLIKLFHRRMLRLCLMLAGPDAPKDHLLFIKVEPILTTESVP